MSQGMHACLDSCQQPVCLTAAEHTLTALGASLTREYDYCLLSC